jgi:hypothetical protein
MIYRVYKKNGAVSKVNKKFISQLSLAQRTPSAAATVQVSCALPVSMVASQQKKAFCVLRFEVFRSLITVQREFCARFRTAGGACDRIHRTEHT